MLPDECRAPASEDGPEGWQQDARKSEDCDFNPESPQRGADDHDPFSIVGVWSKDEGMKVEARIVKAKFESRAILALGDATCFFSISWAREFPGDELSQLSGIRYRAFYHGTAEPVGHSVQLVRDFGAVAFRPAQASTSADFVEILSQRLDSHVCAALSQETDKVPLRLRTRCPRLAKGWWSAHSR